jgi:RES domain-containing protein
MRLYKIGKTKYAHDLSGIGAKLYGGRWNHEGIPCIYLAESRALSLLEYTAHTGMATMPATLCFTTFEVPELSIRQFSVHELPVAWLQKPHCRENRDFASSLLAQTNYFLLKLPSPIIEQEFNFVMNIQHPLINSVKITDITSFGL